MKTPLFILLLSLFSVSSFAQVASVDNQVQKSTQMDQLKIKRHTQSATQQIKIHLNNNLVYPEQMQDYLIEGRIDLEVMFSKTGKIKKVKIVKSNSELMDNAVLKAMASMEQILVRDAEYLGEKTLSFPIKFSLKN